jgi:hypothetical protein
MKRAAPSRIVWGNEPISIKKSMPRPTHIELKMIVPNLLGTLVIKKSKSMKIYLSKRKQQTL